ncbi:uncharacterized protein G2W53_003680 [Senna tora]|uniref:Uncharacterized protein n=1 Tax=Senna tora TaxID=362788 RepID=A0A835CJH1_9FABA|nr:uncharacterized protein G2W53_003680 [Senna tora]
MGFGAEMEGRGEEGGRVWVTGLVAGKEGTVWWD